MSYPGEQVLILYGYHCMRLAKILRCGGCGFPEEPGKIELVNEAQIEGDFLYRFP